MGHLVFGRYGSKDKNLPLLRKGWMERLWRNLVAYAHTKPR
jgi:hypothetical protein